MSTTDVTVGSSATLAVNLGQEQTLRTRTITVHDGGTLAAQDGGGIVNGVTLGEGTIHFSGGDAAGLNVGIAGVAVDAGSTLCTDGTVNITGTAADAGVSIGRLSVVSGTTTLARGTSVTVASITGDGQMAVFGTLHYGGESLDVASVLLDGATVSAASSGTVCSMPVTVTGGTLFVGSWTLSQLEQGAELRVGGESSLEVGNRCLVQEIEACDGGGAAVTLADGSVVNVLSMAGSNSALSAGGGTLSIGALRLSGTDASGVVSLIVTGDSFMGGGATAKAVQVSGDAASLEVEQATLGSLSLTSGRVSTTGETRVNAVSVAGCVLDLAGDDLLSTSPGTSAAITMTGGSLLNAGSYAGTVDVTEAAGSLAMGGLTEAATLMLQTSGTGLQLTGLSGVTLGDGSSIRLTPEMLDLPATQSLLQFGAAGGSTRVADSGTASVALNDVLQVIVGSSADSVTGEKMASFTVGSANADLSGLNGAVSFDAVMTIFNMTAVFTEDGKLNITQYSPL